jgi:hypothetical protein
MSKVLSFLLSLLIGLQSMGMSLENITKLDTLIKHAKFHQEQYGDDFFEFLANHYGNTNHEQNNEHQEHQDLPFKHQNCAHSSLTFVLSSPDISFDFKSVDLPHSPLFSYLEPKTSTVNSTVFQPPKQA